MHPPVPAEHSIGLTVSPVVFGVDCHAPVVQAPVEWTIDGSRSWLQIRRCSTSSKSALKEKAWSYRAGPTWKRHLITITKDRLESPLIA